jgi:hypothetical protein
MKMQTPKERMEMLMETGEFDFINDIPKEQFWKLVFFVTFVYSIEKAESEDKE